MPRLTSEWQLARPPPGRCRYHLRGRALRGKDPAGSAGRNGPVSLSSAGERRIDARSAPPASPPAALRRRAQVRPLTRVLSCARQRRAHRRAGASRTTRVGTYPWAACLGQQDVCEGVNERARRGHGRRLRDSGWTGKCHAPLLSAPHDRLRHRRLTIAWPDHGTASDRPRGRKCQGPRGDLPSPCVRPLSRRLLAASGMRPWPRGPAGGPLPTQFRGRGGPAPSRPASESS